MSIVRLNKVTLVGLMPDKASLLEDLQQMGCVEIITLRSTKEEPHRPGITPGAEEALKFLRDCPARRRQIQDPARFDASEVEKQVLAVRQRLQNLQDERDFLIRRIRNLRAWGDFEFPSPEEMSNLHFWFYVVPHAELPKVQALPYYQEIVKRDNRFSYLIVISEAEPEDMPVPRVHLGAKPQHVLLARLDDVELAIEDAQAERAYLTRWYDLFRRNLAALKDRAALSDASGRTLHKDPVFALQGWAPTDHVSTLARYARERTLCFNAEKPVDDELPPTLLQNPSWLCAGEDLVNFYMTPGYRTWDPASTVFISFAVFFAMILADAGYGAVLGLVLLLYWKRMGQTPSGRRYRPLCTTLVATSLAYGMLVGSYFGLSPPPGSLPGKLHLLDMSDTNLMMAVSVLIGCIHVIVASVMDAARHARWRDGLASVGWALIVSGGFALVLREGFGLALPLLIPVAFAVLGAVLVILYSAPSEPPFKRSLLGLLGLTNVSGAFGDVLSYLRLFALGLASGSLAAEFNHMAAGIMSALPGVGLFFALLVLILGHGVNLMLGLASSVIHGMRLNVIEFFKWGLKEEGPLFSPLRRSAK